MHDEDTCCVDGCDEPMFIRRSHTYPHLSGTCKRHYMRVAAYRPPPVREPLPARECLWCGAGFQPCRSNHRCCTKDCATLWSINGRSRLDRILDLRECEWCGESFQPARRAARHCSKRCGHASKCRLRYMRKKVNGRVEDFSRQSVFQRDDWTCRLCGEPIDPTVAYPDPMSASIDHVVPIALGGEHVFHNVQAAHLSCNVRKNATLRGQIHMAI